MVSLDSWAKKVFFLNLLAFKFEECVTTLLKKFQTIGSYTPHGISHIKGVEASIEKLLNYQKDKNSKGENEPLVKDNHMEYILLKLCAWGHDLGMITEVANRFREAHDSSRDVKQTLITQYRLDHDIASAYFIREEIPQVINTLFSEFDKGKFNEEGVQIKIPQQCESDIKTFLESLRMKEDTEEFIKFIKDKSNKDYLQAEALTVAHTVNLISRYHRRIEKLESCPEERYILGEPIRSKLLAAIFRMADALHVDRTRFSKEIFDDFRISPDFTEENRIHWIKSYIISSIHIDEEQFIINIQADLPAETEMETSQNYELFSNSKIKDMLKFIEIDLEEDLLSVSRILLKHSFPPLLGVRLETQIIPEMGYSEDIKASLDNLLAAASPNTSQLIDIALKRLQERLQQFNIRSDLDLESDLKKLIEIQINAITQQLEKRPCHEGLRKIKDLLTIVSQIWNCESEKTRNEIKVKLDTISNTFADIKGRGRDKLIWHLLESLYRVFLDQRYRVEEEAKVDDIRNLLDGYSNIIVYGFSQQVIKILRNFFAKQLEFKKRPPIHILECRTKTLYTSTGQIIYLDALRYADRLKQEVQHIGEMSVEPDVAIGHIIQQTKEKKTAILFGSNAVYENGTFVHSMGHLTIAAAAKAWGEGKADVIVLTDGMKIGEKPADSKDVPQERNLEQWLTPNRDIINRFKSMRIKLHNWQEDHVPRDFIDKLIVLDWGKVLERPSIMNLQEFKFNPLEKYCEKLECSLLAAVLDHSTKDESISKLRETEFSDKTDNERNWICADRYLKQKKDRNTKDQLPPKLVKWIQQIWLDSHSHLVEELIEFFNNECQRLKVAEKTKKKDG